MFLRFFYEFWRSKVPFSIRVFVRIMGTAREYWTVYRGPGFLAGSYDSAPRPNPTPSSLWCAVDLWTGCYLCLILEKYCRLSSPGPPLRSPAPAQCTQPGVRNPTLPPTRDRALPDDWHIFRMPKLFSPLSYRATRGSIPQHGGRENLGGLQNNNWWGPYTSLRSRPPPPS